MSVSYFLQPPQQVPYSLLDLPGSYPINNGIQSWRDQVMQDVQQDGDSWGNPLPGQISDDQYQQDCAEEEDEDKVGATCAQCFGHSSLRFDPEHNTENKGVWEYNENEVRAQQGPTCYKLI